MYALAQRLGTGLTCRSPPRPARGLLRVPREALHAQPAREELSLLDKAISMTPSFLCLLVPAVWILSYLVSYKKKE